MDYFGFSKELKLDKFLPKEFIYKQIGAKESVKKLFVENIEKIKIRSSIKEEGTNIKAYKNIEEKEVYEEILFLKIEVKKKGKEEKIVDIFHNIFPRQTVIELKFNDLIYLSCASKKIGRTSQVIEKVYNTGWFQEEKEKEFIESLNYKNYDLKNLKTFYESIVKRIRAFKISENSFTLEKIEEKENKFYEINETKELLNNLKEKLRKEKQPRKKVEYVNEVKKANKKLEILEKLKK